jgi:hypothetical protein
MCMGVCAHIWACNAIEGAWLLKQAQHSAEQHTIVVMLSSPLNPSTWEGGAGRTHACTHAPAPCTLPCARAPTHACRTDGR